MSENTDHICPYCDRKVKGVDKLGSAQALKKHFAAVHKNLKCKRCGKLVTDCHDWNH